jgi:hypothetical protein
MAIH